MVDDCSDWFARQKDLREEDFMVRLKHLIFEAVSLEILELLLRGILA